MEDWAAPRATTDKMERTVGIIVARLLYSMKVILPMSKQSLLSHAADGMGFGYFGDSETF